MLKQLNDTINYIEEHLLDEKVIDEAMKRVSVSELHFKNVFFFLTGNGQSYEKRNIISVRYRVAVV